MVDASEANGAAYARDDMGQCGWEEFTAARDRFFAQPAAQSASVARGRGLSAPRDQGVALYFTYRDAEAAAADRLEQAASQHARALGYAGVLMIEEVAATAPRAPDDGPPTLAARHAAYQRHVGRLGFDGLATGDELESLGDAFNQMAARLRGLYDDLEQRVEDRTAGPDVRARGERRPAAPARGERPARSRRSAATSRRSWRRCRTSCGRR